jgi:hypothetical protein
VILTFISVIILCVDVEIQVAAARVVAEVLESKKIIEGNNICIQKKKKG